MSMGTCTHAHIHTHTGAHLHFPFFPSFSPLQSKMWLLVNQSTCEMQIAAHSYFFPGFLVQAAKIKYSSQRKSNEPYVNELFSLPFSFFRKSRNAFTWKVLSLTKLVSCRLTFTLLLHQLSGILMFWSVITVVKNGMGFLKQFSP